MNGRRKLVIAFGASALAAPFSSFTQQPGKVWRIGFLRSQVEFSQTDSYLRDAFLGGLRDFGYVEGKNLVVEWRFAAGKYERLPGLAAELVRLKVDLIVAPGNPAASAAQKATTTIPIVLLNVSDPVATGIVRGLARPGGNITGLMDFSDELAPKNLEILLGINPGLNRVALLYYPTSTASITITKRYQPAAEKLGVTLLPMPAENAVEIEKAFSRMNRENARAVMVVGGNLFSQQMRQIAELAVEHRLLSAATQLLHVQGGILMSYAPNQVDNNRRAAYYVDRILKGANPGDLPVEQPTRFELVINMKTAKALGLTIPQSILARADRVIE